MGLANKVVPDDELDAEVDAWCEQILKRSPQGLRFAKLAMNVMDLAKSPKKAKGGGAGKRKEDGKPGRKGRKPANNGKKKPKGKTGLRRRH